MDNSMNVFEGIASRRFIRTYQDKLVAREIL
jgi:hypothetical protein